MTTNSDNTCIICAEKFTSSVRAKTNCPYCDFISCRKCCETFLLSENIPRCMNNDCRKEWTRQHLVNIFTKVFVNKTLRDHREEVLFERELGLLPATQIVIERMNEQEKILNRIADIDAEIRDLYVKRRELQNEYYSLKDKQPKQLQRNFIRACPDENCRGFLSQQWKCGICEKYTCNECHIIKGKRNDDDHVCNPDDVATAKLIASDTKPCPKCATGIFKIEGCDQMFCTACNTGFSWRTGHIETRIHNPHYFEWLHRTGGAQNTRTPGDIQCGRILDYDFMRNLQREMTRRNMFKPDTDRARKIVESINHLQDIVLPRYATDQMENNQELRIQYMRNLITEKLFKTQIQRSNKKYEKKREYYDILDMCINASTDVMYRFYDFIRKTNIQPEDQIKYRVILDEVDTIVTYANKCFETISRTYDCKSMEIRLRTISERTFNNVFVKA
jgi:hypothetical protein